MFELKSLEGTTALVTGASRGLGKQIALSLATAGANVIICARDPKKLQSTVNQAKLTAGKLLPLVVNANSAAGVKKAIKKVQRSYQKLDILVNNVGGVEQFGDFENLTYQDWEDALWQNLMSNVIFTRESLALLKKSENGRIINICTVPAIQPGKFNPHYSAAKAGVLNLTKYLSGYLAKNKILVNALVLSSIEGETWRESIADKAKRENLSLRMAQRELNRDIAQKVPLGRLGKEEEVANLVVFLASKKASFITGAIINVDGGTIRSI